jgi:hypothetical protein
MPFGLNRKAGGLGVPLDLDYRAVEHGIILDHPPSPTNLVSGRKSPCVSDALSSSPHKE